MQRIADYEIIQPLGEGSQGEAWLAKTPSRLGIDDEVVAIKTVTHAASDDDFERVADHLLIYASLESPYLASLYDFGQQGGILYFAGEYFSGGSLARPARPFGRADVLRAVANGARGANELHDAGIAHRAIRPGNILVDNEKAKLGDLGLTQILNPGQTVASQGQVGAVEFIPPEVIQGQSSSRASDVWAIGATLHKVLTGQPMYPNLPTNSLIAALRHILNNRPAMGDALRNGERHIIEACVAADPAERPATAEALATAIETEADRQSESS